MHRTECTPTTTNLDQAATATDRSIQPAITIPINISSDELEPHLYGGDEKPLTNTEIDVTYRYQTSEDKIQGAGVLAVTDNITGEFIVEANAHPALIEEVVERSKEYAHTTGGDAFRIRLSCNDGTTHEYAKDVLLVFNREGTLLRDKSLIPNNIHI